MRVSKSGALALVVTIGCASAPPPRPPEQPPEPPRATLSIRLVDATEADPASPEEAIPRSTATLIVLHEEGGREEQPLGLLDGACSHAAAEAPDLIVIRCWWAGAGGVLRVRRIGEELVAAFVGSSESGELPPEERARMPLRPEIRLDAISPTY